MVLQIACFCKNLLRLMSNAQDIKQAQSMIKKENLFNAIDSCGNTLLHVAAESNNLLMTKFFIDSGSDVDVENNFGYTPVMLARNNNFDDIVEILSKVSSNSDWHDNFDNNTLITVMMQKLESDYWKNSKEEIAKKLSDAKWTLQSVIALKDAELTKYMLQCGYEHEIDEKTGSSHQTALHLSVKAADIENVKVLLKCNAYVNVVDFYKRTPLSYVYGEGDYFSEERFDILKILLDHCAILISAEPRNPEKAHEIFEFESREAIQLLLKINTERFLGFYQDAAIHGAVGNKNPGVIEDFHRKGFDVANTRTLDHKGYTPLMTAASRGNVYALKYLLNAGVDVNAVDFEDGFTAIVFAFVSAGRGRGQYQDSVQLLLENGAELESLGGTFFNLITNEKQYPIANLAISHLALQEAKGIPISQNISDEINSRKGFKTYFESSQQQLSMKIYQSISLFNLLTATDSKHEHYARNEELKSKIENVISALSEYYYFRSILQRRLSNAIDIVALKKEAGGIICKIMGTSYERFPLITDTIVNYLERQDMKNLIDAVV